MRPKVTLAGFRVALVFQRILSVRDVEPCHFIRSGFQCRERRKCYQRRCQTTRRIHRAYVVGTPLGLSDRTAGLQ